MPQSPWLCPLFISKGQFAIGWKNAQEGWKDALYGRRSEPDTAWFSALLFYSDTHTYAKLIEIQKNYLQKIHGLHELGSQM